MFTNKAEQRIEKLHDSLLSLETSLTTLNTELTSLRPFIDSRVLLLHALPHGPITITPPTSLTSEYEASRHAMASTYSKAILKAAYAQLKDIDTELVDVVARVERLRKKLAYKMEKEDLDDDNEWPEGRINGWIYEMQLLRRWRLVRWEKEGDEWGYFDEWLEEIQKLHEVVWEQIRGMPGLG